MGEFLIRKLFENLYIFQFIELLTYFTHMTFRKALYAQQTERNSRKLSQLLHVFILMK